MKNLNEQERKAAALTDEQYHDYLAATVRQKARWSIPRPGMVTPEAMPGMPQPAPIPDPDFDQDEALAKVAQRVYDDVLTSIDYNATLEKALKVVEDFSPEWVAGVIEAGLEDGLLESTRLKDAILLGIEEGCAGKKMKVKEKKPAFPGAAPPFKKKA